MAAVGHTTSAERSSPFVRNSDHGPGASSGPAGSSSSPGGIVRSHQSSKLSFTRSPRRLTTTPELGGVGPPSAGGAGGGTGIVNQSFAWSQTSSMSSAVARCDRSGGKPPMSTAASSISHHRGAGAPG